MRRLLFYLLVVLRSDGKDLKHGKKVCISMSIGNETQKVTSFKYFDFSD